ncbi:addiction module toxin RelE [Algiphilus sp.]|uniref:addiction module toxin RelE n=1 Tax=Algiphilus sp. TaxID=1872431 RepID=UPI001CA5F77B|nr:addiction module toxin RelE [Algiphilus acroporae]MCI5063519.1 addiction module toxin RelE [Algiphilus sp.]
MKAVFVELPAFEQRRSDYLTDGQFSDLQRMLMDNPEAGDLIQGAGGVRKLRYADSRRGKGKRGGLRVIYYWWSGGPEFWLFTLYNKDEVSDLTAAQRKAIGQRVKAEVAARSKRR